MPARSSRQRRHKHLGYLRNLTEGQRRVVKFCDRMAHIADTIVPYDHGRL